MLDQEPAAREIEQEARRLLDVCGSFHAPIEGQGGQWIIQYFRDRADVQRRRAAERFVDDRRRGVEVPEIHEAGECRCGVRLLNPMGDLCLGCAIEIEDPTVGVSVLRPGKRALCYHASCHQHYGEAGPAEPIRRSDLNELWDRHCAWCGWTLTTRAGGPAPISAEQIEAEEAASDERVA